MLSQASAQALARLRAYTPPPTNYNKLPLTRRAAVLILLFPDRYGDLKVVLTMRAATLRNYAGQVALPGGKADSLEEKPFEVARREAYEEIGLPITDARLPPGFRVEHLCELPTHLAKTELGVRPCVAFLSPTSTSTSSSTPSSTPTSSSSSSEAVDVEETMIPRLDPKEVAAVFTAPFAQFLKKEWMGRGGPVNSKGGRHSWYRGTWVDWHESRWRMHNFYMPKPSTPTLRKNPSNTHNNTGSNLNTRLHTDTDADIQTRFRKKDQEKGKGEPEGDDPRPEPTAFEELQHFRVFGMTARILVDAARLAYGTEPEFEHNSHFGDENMIERLRKIGRLSEIRKKGEELTAEVMREALQKTSKL